MKMLKTNIFLEVMNDIITEYPDTKNFIRKKIVEKCSKEGIWIDQVIFFFFFLGSSETKHF